MTSTFSIRQLPLPLALAAGLAFLGGPATARGAEPSVQVTGARITLGDINPTLPREVLNVDLAPAPLPGQARTISRDAVRGALARAGADERLADGMPARVDVERSAKRISRGQLEKDVEALALTKLPVGVEVTSILGLEDVTLPDVEHELDLRWPRLAAATRATLTIKAEGRTWVSRPVTLNLSGTPKAPTLKRARPRKAVVTDKDIVMAPTTLERLPTRAALRKEDVVGQVLTQPTAAGRPIQTSALAPKPMIERGREINLVVVGQGLRITQTVRAEEDGAAQEWIRVRSIDGGRTLEAKVIQPGEVQIEIGGAR